MEARRSPAYGWILLLALLATTAAVPRFLLSADIDPGQPQWTERCVRFWSAVRQGNFRATLIAPHPGLTLLWLGGAAQDLGGADGLEDRAVAASRALALATALLVVVCAELLRRLLRHDRHPAPAFAAAVAAFALAVDPVLILTGGLIGLDGLFTLLLLAALLALLLHWRDGRRGSLVAACLLGGLATATKGPGLLLVAMAPFVRWQKLRAPRRPGWGAALATALLLAAASVAVVAALLPAAWVDPLDIARRLLYGGNRGNESLVTVLVRPSPTYRFGGLGPLGGLALYLANLLFRLTPLALLGAFAGLFRRDFRASALVRQIAFFGLLFLLAISLARQREWRYMIPVQGALDVLGALGVVAAARGLAERTGRARLTAALPALLFGLQAVWVWAGHPYYELRTDPLLGGPRVAVRVVQLGWTGGFRETMAFLGDESKRLGRTVRWTGGAFKWRLYRPNRQNPDVVWAGRDPGTASADCHAISIEDDIFSPDETDKLWLDRGVLAKSVVVDGLTLVRIRCLPELGFRPEGAP